MSKTCKGRARTVLRLPNSVEGILCAQHESIPFSCRSRPRALTHATQRHSHSLAPSPLWNQMLEGGVNSPHKGEGDDDHDHDEELSGDG
jgi:hypothetical protein